MALIMAATGNVSAVQTSPDILSGAAGSYLQENEGWDMLENTTQYGAGKEERKEPEIRER